MHAVNQYSLRNAARILKVSPSRLRYWERTELMGPRAGEGSSEFDFRDLVSVKGVLSLLEKGISLQRIRRSVEVLREHLPDIEDPLVALRLWAEGSERMVVEHDGVLVEPNGQMVLDFQGVPRSVPVLYGILLVVFLSLPRFVYRSIKDQGFKERSGERVLIVGAGSAGEMLVRDLMRDRRRAYVPVAFVDVILSSLVNR